MTLYRSPFANKSAKKPNTRIASSKAPVWIVPAGVSVALVVLSILAYFIGVTRQDVYFGLRGLDWQLFPLDKPDYIYLGAISTIDSALTAIDAVSKKWEFLLGLAAVGLIVGLAIALDNYLRVRVPVRRLRLKWWQKEALFLIVTTLGMPSLFFFPVLVLVIALLLPASIGDAVARQAVSRENAIIRQGCDHAPPYMGCFELHDGSRVVAWGFLLHGTKHSVLLHDGINASMWSLEKRDLVRASAQTKKSIEQNVSTTKPGQ